MKSPFSPKKSEAKPEPFKNMTSRGLTVNDFADSAVVPANVFIRNKPMWAISLDDKRFDNIEKDPEILTRTKKTN